MQVLLGSLTVLLITPCGGDRVKGPGAWTLGTTYFPEAIQRA